jgi:hypothetical protein
VLLPQMMFVCGRKVDGRCGEPRDVGTGADRAQVAKDLEDIESFPVPGPGTNASSAATPPLSELRGVTLGEPSNDRACIALT